MLFIGVDGRFSQIFSTKSQFRRLRPTSGAGVCSAAVPARRPARPCCPASGPSSVSSAGPSPPRRARLRSHLLSNPPAVAPREGCLAWCRSTEEEEDERRGSRKKGRSRRCGPYREHSADARYGPPPPFPEAETKPVLLYFRLPGGSVKPPHEGSRQRSCSAPNLRRSPRHSPAVPGVPSLVESGKSSFLLPNGNHGVAS